MSSPGYPCNLICVRSHIPIHREEEGRNALSTIL